MTPNPAVNRTLRLNLARPATLNYKGVPVPRNGEGRFSDSFASPSV